MTRVKVNTEQYAVIGDLVDSRNRGDRRALHEHLIAALEQTNSAVDADDPLVVTVGDEFQGVYATLGAALAATLHTRLAMIEHADCRFGIGRGTITPLDDEGSLQDGPAWWAARDALGYVEETAERAATRAMRTSYRCAPDGADAEQADKSLQDAVNAALACRDHLVGSMSDRSRRLLGGLMHGTPQRELAEAERISPSAVSQRIRADGLAMLLASETLLAGLR